MGKLGWIGFAEIIGAIYIWFFEKYHKKKKPREPFVDDGPVYPDYRFTELPDHTTPTPRRLPPRYYRRRGRFQR